MSKQAALLRSTKRGILWSSSLAALIPYRDEECMNGESQDAAPDCAESRRQDRSVVGIREDCIAFGHRSLASLRFPQ